MLGVFLDSETNGLDIQKHRIIELAYKIVDLQTGEVLDTFDTPFLLTLREWKKSDLSSLRINGFSWDDLKDGMQPSQAAEMIQSSFERFEIKRDRAVFICQNSSFDRAFFSQLIGSDRQEYLGWPYHWLDLASMYWCRCIREEGRLPWKNGVSKNTIALALGLPPEPYPHKAMNGVNHLIVCYEAVVGFPGKSQSLT